MGIQFLPCGDTGVSVQFGNVVERSLNEHVVRTKMAIDASDIPGILETVPSYRALLINYDPLQTSQAEMIEQIKPLLNPSTGVPLHGRHWRVPSCYDLEFAIDLQEVAGWSKMSVNQVVTAHTSVIHYIYMIGFAPGQPYMGDLPEEIAIPRRKNPRQVVEKGSVLTATGFTVIYPITNASGWHIIGRSPVPIFDIKNDPPGLLNSGDTVQFYSIPIVEFREIEKAIEAGEWELKATEPER